MEDVTERETLLQHVTDQFHSLFSLFYILSTSHVFISSPVCLAVMAAVSHLHTQVISSEKQEVLNHTILMKLTFPNKLILFFQIKLALRISQQRNTAEEMEPKHHMGKLQQCH